jgi:hypothetical protein
MRLEDVGISALQSRILCEGHNTRLSPLDAVAARLLGTLDRVDKAPGSVPVSSLFAGEACERWLLKVTCGLVAAGAIGDEDVPDRWKGMLAGGEWPEGWGMYLGGPDSTPQVLAREVLIETKVQASTKRILAVRFSMFGVVVWLLLGRPDHPQAFGVHRPRGIIFHGPNGERRVEFAWPVPSDQAVIYTRVGGHAGYPPHWHGWK